MKKLMPIALCLVLLLSGCGLSEQIAAVREEYIDPAIERADSGNLDQPESDSVLTGPNISTDRSLISDVPVYEPLYSRAQEGYMSVLEEGWSGTLLPIGSGLATSEGEIVLDPVLASATPAVCTVEGEEYTLQIYILENSEGMFAACSAYGDWVTDFAYTEIIPFELGVLCISDAEANLAVCYSSEGEVLFDTADFSARGQLAPGSVASLAQYGSGYMLCEYANGQWGFLSTDGTFLNRDSDLPSYFDGASPFSNGLAAVSNNGAWGYINAEGGFVIERQYEQATPFAGGHAAVLSGGNWSVINTSGTVVLELGAVSAVTVTPGYIEADGTYYTVNDYTEAVFFGYTGIPCDEGFWVRGTNGVRVFRSDGTQVYFSGGAALLDNVAGLWLVELADGIVAAMDDYSRVVAAGVSEIVTDGLTGLPYAITEDGSLYDSSGALVAQGCTGLVLKTYAQCESGPYRGYTASSGEWVIRMISDTLD